MKKPRKCETARLRPKSRAKIFIVTALVLTLIAATAILGQRASRQKQTRSADIAPASLTPGNPSKRTQTKSDDIAPASLTSPSKEYIYAGGRLVATEEPAQGCSYSLSATSQSFAADNPSGGNLTGSITITAPGGCNWTAVSNNSWITITSGSSGSGNGTVSYTVAHNTTTSPRSGTISIAGQTFTVLQGVAFTDVPTTHPYYTEIGKFSARGITSGCSFNPPLYCPDSNVTRAQMAVFLLRGIGVFTPPTPAGQTFCDVPTNYWVYTWIEELFRRGITAGCGSCQTPPPSLIYCPENSVSHAEMAVFILRSMGINPPQATGQTFQDVPTNYWAYNFIEEINRRGIWTGCGPCSGGICYCPEGEFGNVTRAQMAVMMVRAFNL